MRRFNVSFAVIVLCTATASLPGQTPGLRSAQIPKTTTMGTLPEPEDSPEASAHNQIFYSSPRLPEPQVSEPAGTVSVDQLQHPISRRGASLLRQGAESVPIDGRQVGHD